MMQREIGFFENLADYFGDLGRRVPIIEHQELCRALAADFMRMALTRRLQAEAAKHLD
ncbi:MAG: hypothetical protein ACREFY_07545 [Acetobacteraceae bacterium]